MATGSTADDEKLCIDWKLVSADGPALTNHVGCIIGNGFYIHGGIKECGSTSPSNKLYKMDLSSYQWMEIHETGSPSLSHHACVVLENRYMVLIGGWDGRRRVSKVHVFDTQEKRWLQMRESGFPEGAGLSSHTATLLSSGEILVVGREGSLRLQRKHGNAYILSGNILRGEFLYRKMTNDTSSRSGHTVNSVGNTLYIVGGRDDKLVEFHPGYSSNELIGSLNSKFSEIAQWIKPTTKLPSGRKNHVSFPGKGCIVIHGGETFDGRSREPVGELFLIATKPHLSFYKIGNSKIARASHICVNTGDKVWIHGGFGGKNVVYGDCYELTFQTLSNS